MNDILIGALLAMLLLNSLAIGFIMGRRSAGEKAAVKDIPSPEVPLSEEEQEKIRKERDELKKEQEAFLSLVGYNVDIAYGLGDNPFEGR